LTNSAKYLTQSCISSVIFAKRAEKRKPKATTAIEPVNSQRQQSKRAEKQVPKATTAIEPVNSQSQ
jgi:hypothetical protein